ncbi:GNAT family N-acetyltransferase [Breznakia pachnodae]|uniref:GNAT superfamily N-acetyltransferase n=1 Tax=Breznakia pachnodae TaxID=265178 RepID=A0ABU0E595_9FIRM|nr:GNAT family N-acetyltransferase [Breznakia pachnodae]MDQ0361991.1 GNAT superfamily N-acetyltransferase [Breznakia pachnodae]
MIIRKATQDEYELSHRLYKRAFPRMERRPWFLFHRNPKTITLYSLLDENKYVGFMIVLEIKDTIYLDYFAIVEDGRGKGYGSKALKLLKEQYKNKTILLELESTKEIAADNYDERVARKKFYKRNGFIDSKLSLIVFGQKVDIMYLGEDIDLKGYIQIFQYAYGKLVTRMMNPKPYL